MINVAQITSRLARLPDQALQQYAMMHKDDPYIMSLAISESRRRKQVRAASHPQAPQEQPKVADQALMEMSPDESGIASLNMGNMDFADGGIVSFADGGGTYETPYDRMNRENRERAEAEQAAREAQAAELGVTPYSDQMRRMYETLVPNPMNVLKTLVSAPGYGLSKDAPAAPAGSVSRPAERMTPQQIEAKAAQGRPAGIAGIAPPVAAGAGTGPSAGIGAPSVDAAKKLAGQFLDTKSLRSDLDKFYADEEAAVAAARKRRDDGKPEGKAYSKYEEMLAKEDAGAAKEKDEATGVAIFKAGLAMMAGTSPRAFENIGKGAMAGLDEYSGAMKDMKKAAKERQKAMADIENARRAEARDDWKVARDFEDKADTRLAKAREFGVRGIMEITGKDAEIASGIYKTQVTEAGATQRTNIQTAALRERALGGGDKQQLSELKALQKTLTDQMKTTFNKGERQQLQAKLGQVEAAIAQMAGLDTMGAAPGAARPGGIPSDVQALLNKYGGK